MFSLYVCVRAYMCEFVCVVCLSMSVFRPSVWNSNDAYFQNVYNNIIFMFVLGHTQKPKMIT